MRRNRPLYLAGVARRRIFDRERRTAKKKVQLGPSYWSKGRNNKPIGKQEPTSCLYCSECIIGEKKKRNTTEMKKKHNKKIGKKIADENKGR